MWSRRVVIFIGPEHLSQIVVGAGRGASAAGARAAACQMAYIFDLSRIISSRLESHSETNQIEFGAGPAPSKGAFGLEGPKELPQSPG